MARRDTTGAPIGITMASEQREAIHEQGNGEVQAASPDWGSAFFSLSLLVQLMQRYHQSLWAYVMGLLREYDAAQDIVQDTWIALFRYIQQHPSSWLKEANIPALLWTMAKHKAINYMKIQQRTSSLDSEDTPLNYEPHVPPFDYPENIALRDEICLALYRAISGLERPQQEVITLKFFGDYSLKEIASMLNMPVGTVKSHVHRGLQQLRRLLTEQGITRSDIGLWETTQEHFSKTILRE